METIRALLVDDHVMFRESLATALEGREGITVAGQAGGGQEALRLVDELHPDVVILDYGMPGMDGVAVTRRVREGGVHPRILFVSMHDNVHYALQALEAGADGYVVKARDVPELARAVRVVFEGNRYVSPPLDELLADAHPSATQGRTGLERLSPREFELLRYLGEGLSLQEASQRMGVVESTASTYRARLMTKLGLQSTHQIIRYAIEHGIVG